MCLQFYRGEGYSAAFVENLTRLIERLASEPAVLVDGADDVCGSCPSLAADGTCGDPHSGEAEIRRIDALACELLGVAAGDTISLPEARRRMAANAKGARRWNAEACAGCSFETVCAPGWELLIDS